MWTPDGNNRTELKEEKKKMMKKKTKKVNGKGRLRSTEELIKSREREERVDTLCG